MSKLKSCPFCGSEAKLCTDGITTIICKDCGLIVSNGGRSIIKLTDQWNRRVNVNAKEQSLANMPERSDGHYIAKQYEHGVKR